MNCNRATILVSGPSHAARAFLADNLSADGHEVLVAASAAAAWQLLDAHAVELVLIDLSDAGRFHREGVELINRIRRAGQLGARVDPALGVMVLAPRLGEVERLRVFERGADDLLQHPYSYSELRARVASLLRRSRGSWAPGRLRIGPLEIDAGSRQVWLEARPVPLSNKEYMLLTALAADPTRVFTRAEILAEVWGIGPYVRTRTLDVHVSRLRRKLAHPRTQFIVNCWGRGYQLTVAGARSGRIGEGAAAAAA